MRYFLLTISLFIFYSTSYSQDYKSKTALIIGNTNYKVGKLRNPVNDAKALSETLESVGFNVIARYDLDRVGLRESIREFGNAIRDKDGIALVYYSGHGLQSNGVNYMVPIDADIQEEWEIEDQCVSADQILRMLNSYENPFNIIILDACRNNPYESRYRSATRGLAQPEIVPTGSIMAFSTAPGKVASDGEGANGLYTQELIKSINTPGLDIEAVFKQTRINVKELSGDQQIPWETSSLVGDFYFREGTSVGTEVVVASTVPTMQNPDKFNVSEEFDGEYFTDPRDQKRYKIVTIGEQTWFAENLRYATPDSKLNDYGDRFYTWKDAKEVCPEGWVLPKTGDLNTISKNYGGYKKAGPAWKSEYGWEHGGGGTNESGMNMKPWGFYLPGGSAERVGFESALWTRQRYDERNGYYWRVSYNTEKVINARANKQVRIPVRCLKGDK